MGNPIPTSPSDLIQLGNRMEAGLVSLGSSLGILQITAAGFQTELTAFTNADYSYNAARTAAGLASTAYNTEDAGTYAWELQARKVLAVYFGDAWNAQW